jgi:hypothetical protein
VRVYVHGTGGALALDVVQPAAAAPALRLTLDVPATVLHRDDVADLRDACDRFLKDGRP